MFWQNIELGWKGLPGANIKISDEEKKSLITLTVGQRGPRVLPEVVQLLAGNGGTGSALEIGLVFPRNPRWTGRISTVDLLALTSSDQLLFTLNTETIFFE